MSSFSCPQGEVFLRIHWTPVSKCSGHCLTRWLTDLSMREWMEVHLKSVYMRLALCIDLNFRGLEASEVYYHSDGTALEQHHGNSMFSSLWIMTEWMRTERKMERVPSRESLVLNQWVKLTHGLLWLSHTGGLMGNTTDNQKHLAIKPNNTNKYKQTQQKPD